ncbi:MAG: sortase [Clostridia bacterium]|nr:sortase [Clostridia bacterium]
MNSKTVKIIILAAVVVAGLIVGGILAGNSCAGCNPDKSPDVTPEPTAEALVTDEPTGIPTEEVTAEPTEVPYDLVSLRRSDAFVTAIATGTYGVAADGSIRFMGSAVSGQNLIFDWSNVVRLAANDTTTAALLKNGTIVITGELEEQFKEAVKWTGVADIAMGESHLVGLLTDGTVIACGDNTHGQCEVTGWTDVIGITAAGYYTAAVTRSGAVTTLGTAADQAINAFPVAGLAAAEDHIAILNNNGTVRTFEVAPASSGDEPSPTPSFEWHGIVKIFASKGATFGIDETGNLFTDSPLIPGPMGNVYYVSASEKHAVVLRGDGSCEGFGDNDLLQCSVSGWRLLPYVSEDGWLLGLVPGTVIDGAPVATGREISYTNPATCETRTVTCVLLGDVNGDGAIDDKDVASAEAHAAGDIKLTGAFFRAANVIADSSKPNSIDINDIEKITAQASGKNAIDQYAKTDQYTALLADARRKNPDALGYITLKGTNISYPIMYGQNWYYNDHDIDRKSSVRGSIYFYWSKANKNIVITGHNSRTSGTMFHELHKLQNNKSKLKTFANRVWCINAYGQTGYWEVWAMYEEPGFRKAEDSSQFYNTNWPNTFNALNEQEKQAWINYQLRKSELGYTVNVTTRDRFMTLTTCGDDHAASQRGARLYFFLRWVGNN